MLNSDYLNDLCEFSSIVFASVEDCQRALARHDALHERKHAEAVVVRTLLRKASAEGWSQLTERERQILMAYSVGADLPV